MERGTPFSTVIWSLFIGVFLVKLLIWQPIVKESVIIIPAFGVQLETQYGSGKISRCFIPVSKILKPVLNECMTPVTCYWCLSLLVRDEDELTLVFKKFCPPLTMLVPIWKALCAASLPLTVRKVLTNFKKMGSLIDGITPALVLQLLRKFGIQFKGAEPAADKTSID